MAEKEQLAYANAKKYRVPSEDIVELDWSNHHAVFAFDGATIRRASTRKTPLNFAEEIAHQRYRDFEYFMHAHVMPKMEFALVNDRFLFELSLLDVELQRPGYSTLAFSVSKDGDHVNVPVPDPSAMRGYSGMLEVMSKDPLPTDHKVDKLFFIGPATGPVSPSDNNRVRLCKYSAKHRDFIEAYLSGMVYDLSRHDESWNAYLHTYVHPKFQTMFRGIVHVDGAGASWDRVPWVLASKSLLWKADSATGCWYDPLLVPYVHYVPFSIDSLESSWMARPNPENTKAMVSLANDFARDTLSLESHVKYAARLFDHIIHLYAP